MPWPPRWSDTTSCEGTPAFDSRTRGVALASLPLPLRRWLAGPSLASGWKTRHCLAGKHAGLAACSRPPPRPH
jgi:hypothetical protein